MVSGCGDYAILSAIQKTMPDLGIPKEAIVFIFRASVARVAFRTP